MSKAALDECRMPIIINDHNMVVKAEVSLDGEGLVVEVRDPAAGNTRAYWDFDGGRWEMLRDGTLGRQTHGTSDAPFPGSARELERALQTELQNEDR